MATKTPTWPEVLIEYIFPSVIWAKTRFKGTSFTGLGNSRANAIDDLKQKIIKSGLVVPTREVVTVDDDRIK